MISARGIILIFFRHNFDGCSAYVFSAREKKSQIAEIKGMKSEASPGYADTGCPGKFVAQFYGRSMSMR